jgi:quercetin dioxygenase-like cupin family protein
MRVVHADVSLDKGWYVGLGNSALTLAVGYATKGIDEPHAHAQPVEIYLVAQGWADVRVEQQTIRLAAGDLLVLDPGEAHAFLSNSPEYFHFVVHVPALTGDKIPVTRVRLGL